MSEYLLLIRVELEIDLRDRPGQQGSGHHFKGDAVLKQPLGQLAIGSVNEEWTNGQRKPKSSSSEALF
jgi:hypothetical protein